MKIVFDFDAEHLWTSKNGHKYVAEELVHKQLVYSKAVLERISHTNKENDDVCLKIGRYKIFGGLETNDPKSELTLSEEELTKLIEFLNKYLGAMKADVDTFIPVDDSEISSLLERFKKVAGDDKHKAEVLLESGVLTNDISVFIENIKKVKTLEEFSNALLKDEDEHFWQDYFENNKWLLGSDYLKVIDERRIDTEHIADFLMKSNDGFVDVVEIKKPNNMNFWSTSLDHGNYVPSSELTKAITQCQKYLYEIERESNSMKMNERIEFTPIAAPTCLLIFGRSKDWNREQQLAYRLLNASLSRIVVVTYDELYKRASNMIGINKANIDSPLD